VTPKTIALSLLIVFCLGFSGYRLFGGGSANKAVRRDLADELAAFVAKEASAGEKGPLLILAPLDERDDPFPGQLATRAEKHMRSAGFDPVTVERVPYNLAIEGTGEPITRETFREVLARHEGAKVVLALTGVPRFTAADLPAGHPPRIIVASTVIMPYLKNLPPGLIEFAVEVKQDAVTDTRTDPALGRLAENFVLRRYK
jgi:hypothetical protein